MAEGTFGRGDIELPPLLAPTEEVVGTGVGGEESGAAAFAALYFARSSARRAAASPFGAGAAGAAFSPAAWSDDGARRGCTHKISNAQR